MTQISATRSEPAQRQPDRPVPTRESGQRFEESLKRSAEEEREGAPSAAHRDETEGAPAVSALLQRQSDDSGDHGEQRRGAYVLDEVARFEAGSGVSAPATDRGPAGPLADAAQASATTVPASHAEMALRMALPQGFHGAETSVLINDPRSIASHLTLSQDPAGMLSLDIGAQHGGGSEQQRQELKARLEARGHRVARIDEHWLDTLLRQ